MKKLLLALAFVLGLATSAQAVVPPPEAIGPTEFTVWPAASFVGLAAWVIYANANGIPFPLCGLQGLQCYDEYPSGRKD